MKHLYRPDLITLRNFGESVLSATARDLALLNAIEETIDALSLEAKQLGSLAEFAFDTAERIKKIDPVKALDPEGTLERILLAGQEKAEEYCETLKAKRQAGRDDCRLRRDDGIEDAYNDVIESVVELHNGLNELRWAVLVHDGLLSPAIGEPTADVDALFAKVGL